MRLHKSAKARDVLMSQNLALSQAERRVLILCDGQRTRAAIENMLGDAASTTIDVLIEQGYLQIAGSPSPNQAASPSKPADGLPKIVKHVLSGATPSAAPQTVSPQLINSVPNNAPKPVVDAQPNAAARRSLAACKMYMLDMLQLQRSMESSALAVDIQTANDEIQLTDSLMQALRHLTASTKASMAERITQRLLETLPEVHLTRLQADITDLIQPTPAQEAGVGNVVAMRRGVA